MGNDVELRADRGGHSKEGQRTQKKKKKKGYVLGTEESAEVTLSRTLKGLSFTSQTNPGTQFRANLGSLALMTS